jgi:hypothetical protein
MIVGDNQVLKFGRPCGRSFLLREQGDGIRDADYSAPALRRLAFTSER